MARTAGSARRPRATSTPSRISNGSPSDTNELIDQVDPPAKIGHSFGQRLLANSIADDEKPAVGWLRNFRVEGKKLVADQLKTPQKFAQLVDAGAFRKRSAEIAKLRRQSADGGDSKVYHVVRAVSWLGAKAPAMRNLDEIAALYSETEEEAERFLAEEADATVVWNPRQGYRWVQERISSALNPRGLAPLASEAEGYYVMDVGPSVALVKRYGDDDTKASLVPFRVEGEEVVLASRDQWRDAQQTWVSVARSYIDFVEPVGDPETSADSRGVPEFTLTEEQVAQFAEKLGVEPDQLDPETVIAQVGELRERAENPPAPPEGDGEGEDEKGVVKMSEDELTELRAMAEEGRAAKTTLWERERDDFLNAAIDDRKITPGAPRQVRADVRAGRGRHPRDLGRHARARAAQGQRVRLRRERARRRRRGRRGCHRRRASLVPHR